MSNIDKVVTPAAGLRTVYFDMPPVTPGQGGDIAKVIAANSAVVILHDLDMNTPRPLPPEAVKLLED